MKVCIFVPFMLVPLAASSRTDSVSRQIPIPPKPFERHCTTTTLGVGFVDEYRYDYTLPPGFIRRNTSGFTPIFGMLEYNLSGHLSLGATAGYDAFSYNYAQQYQGNYDPFTRYRINKTRVWTTGLNLYYHFTQFHSRHFDPFFGMGVALNNIHYSAWPQGDSTVIKTDHTVTPYLKAGTRYYISNAFSLFAAAGYDKHTILNLGFSVRFVKSKFLPDTDGDGVPDIRDSCVSEPGIVRLFGCPDSDGDGIPDKDDSCPHQSGLARFHGCPDSDGDGVPDQRDHCPTVPGTAIFNGCPDNDGDGIPDPEDSCVHIAGLKEFNGCPDSDGDGIPDNKDACPHQPGPATNNGCPLAAPVQLHEHVLPVNIILFPFGKSTISISYCKALDEVASFLKENSAVGLTIEGYTDITGTTKINKHLSLARAKSIKKYLTSKGIAASRMVTIGHGSKAPAASNRTRAGRAKNRRVTLKLMGESGR